MKNWICLLFAFLLCFSAGACTSQSKALHQEDFITTVETDTDLSAEYYLLSKKYYPLYQTLQFDIYIPANMKIYDSGEQSGRVILTDSSAKNFLMMENRQKSDYTVMYREFLNAVTCNIGDRDRIKTYEDFTLTVHHSGMPLELHAKRFDIKVDDTQKDSSSGTVRWYTIGQKCISYWFIDFDQLRNNADNIIPSTFMIMTESFIPVNSSDYSNTDILQNILTTIDVTNLLDNAA